MSNVRTFILIENRSKQGRQTFQYSTIHCIYRQSPILLSLTKSLFQLFLQADLPEILNQTSKSMIESSIKVNEKYKIIQKLLVCALLLQSRSQAKRRNKSVFNYCQTSVLSFTNGGILSGYQKLLALHLSGTPSLKTGDSPPSCQLLDNQLSMTFDVQFQCLYQLCLTVYYNFVASVIK